MAGLVVDASALLTIAFDSDEEHRYGVAVVDEVIAAGARVPPLFWYEIRNALLVSERRGRGTPDTTAAFLSTARELPIEVAALTIEDGVLDIGRRYGLTAYDAAYLDLAIRTGSALATLDKKLRDAASRSAVEVFEAAR